MIRMTDAELLELRRFTLIPEYLVTYQQQLISTAFNPMWFALDDTIESHATLVLEMSSSVREAAKRLNVNRRSLAAWMDVWDAGGKVTNRARRRPTRKKKTA